MAPKITWDDATKRFFQTGVDKGVLYPVISDGTYPAGVAWNGLKSVTESPSGAEANPQYADNIKYLNFLSREEFAGNIAAFYYPKEFAACDGSAVPTPGVSIGQQTRQGFGFSYRVLLGNDTLGVDYGYKLHLVWGALASPSEKANNSVNDSPEATEFSWDFTTTPVGVTGKKPTSHIVLDSTLVDPALLTALEVILYGVAGSPGTAARLPLPNEIITLMTPAG